jgi:molybdate transport repressor ModE-like protein
MALSPALDLDLVRTLALIAEERSFTRAAERVGRTQSAVSLQVQRLEALVGHPLIARGRGGGVELTAHGKTLVERGRALLALNDDILLAGNRNLARTTEMDNLRCSRAAPRRSATLVLVTRKLPVPSALA